MKHRDKFNFVFATKCMSPNNCKSLAKPSWLRNKNEKVKMRLRIHLLVCGIVPVCYYFIWTNEFFDLQLLPSVRAVSISKDSLRRQFNFIADIVEKSANAVVCVDIKDTHRWVTRWHEIKGNFDYTVMSILWFTDWIISREVVLRWRTALGSLSRRTVWFWQMLTSSWDIRILLYK